MREKLYAEISRTYTLSRSSEIASFLGLHIQRDRPRRAMFVNQVGYVRAFLEQFNIPLPGPTTYPPRRSPIRLGRIAPTDSPLLTPSSITQYQTRVGVARFLVDRTRTDLYFALRRFAVKIMTPTLWDWDELEYFLQHIASTPDLGLLFHSPEGVNLYGFADISYASMPNLRSFTSGSLSIGRSSAAFQVLCKPQTVMADSSTVGEYIGFAQMGKLVVSARMFLDAIGFPMTTPTDLYQDNQSTIKLLENSTNGARTKHIAIRFQLIKEYIKRRMLRPVYLRTEDMVPDLINKLHGPTGTRHLRALLLGYNNGIDPTKWIPPEQLL